MASPSLFAEIFKSERDSRVAVIFEQHEISYRELRQLIITTAEKLNALNVRRGDRIAILLNDSPEFVASFVAIISLGAIAVPINMALRTADQQIILKDCGARIAFVENQSAASLFADPIPAVEHLLFVCRAGESEPFSPLGIHSQSFEAAEQRPLSPDFPARGNLDDDAFILYTSGSTGEPKGAVHSQSDIFYTNETFCREVLSLRAGDRLFSSSRLPFAYGLGNAFTFPLLNGLTSILCREKPAPDVVARTLREARPTIFFGVPLVYRMLLEHHRHGQSLDTSSLRLCISAGEALPAQLGEDWQRTFGVEVLDGIGSTEMLHMFISNHAGEARYGSSGKLLGGYDAKLVDHEGQPIPPGAEGNLWIRGGSAARRYWERPEISAETFVDGWTRTGDLYRQDADGFWWHMGRSDDCFKPTGQWVSPVEVEGVLLKCDRIRAAAVVEGLDPDGLSCVCAFVVRANENDEEKTIEEVLRSLCESALPRFKRPLRYIFAAELPYTATGKIQRFKLREQLRAETRS